MTALLAAPGLDVNATAGDGYTALMFAADGGHTETVTVLLAAPGLDVNAADGVGQTALNIAEGYGHVEIVSLLYVHVAVVLCDFYRDIKTVRASK